MCHTLVIDFFCSYHANLRYQLQRPHLAGTYTHRHAPGPITIEIPAVVSPARWEALQAALRATSPTKRTVNRFYPLTSTPAAPAEAPSRAPIGPTANSATCKCSRAASKLDPDDRCPHYPRNLPADQIEDQVWEARHRLLTDPGRLEDAATRHLAAAQHA